MAVCLMAGFSGALTPLGATLRVERLVKHYGRVCAIDNVSFDCAAGEFLSVLGPSGSGKTSVLMTMAGFEAPDGGEILIAGRPVTWLPANRRNLGVVFQSYTLFPHMTVRDNIGFPLRMRSLSRAEIDRRVAEALDLVRLGSHGARLPSELSGGQQQRIAIARAIVFRPPVLLMDEPLGALDRRLREDMQIEIKRLHRELGMTVVYVTHDQEEALSMSDRVAVMRNGRLEQIGSPRDLYQNPATPFVADFLGQMNFISGEVSDGHLAIDRNRRISLSGYRGSSPKHGESARIGVRPERVRLSRQPDDDDLTGKVLADAYSGGSEMVHVDIGNGTVVRSRMPVDHGSARWQPGEQVGVSWSASDGQIFAAASPTG